MYSHVCTCFSFRILYNHWGNFMGLLKKHHTHTNLPGCSVTSKQTAFSDSLLSSETRQYHLWTEHEMNGWIPRFRSWFCRQHNGASYSPCSRISASFSTNVSSLPRLSFWCLMPLDIILRRPSLEQRWWEAHNRLCVDDVKEVCIIRTEK